MREPLAAQIRRERVEAAVLKVVEAAKIDKVEGLSPDLLGRPEAKAAPAPAPAPAAGGDAADGGAADAAPAPAAADAPKAE